MKTQFISQLPKAIQNAVKKELEQAGLSKEDISNAMDSRLSDLADTINIEQFDSMKVSILNFMQKEDPNGDWDVSEANEIPEAYMLETLQNWLDDGLEMNNRIQSYVSYLGKFI